MLAIVLQLLSLSLARDLLPKTVDWRTEGVVSPVKNQLAYNNSWAFAGTGALEGAMKITTGVLYSLSEQQLIDCIPANLTLSNEDNTIEQAFKYVRDNGLCMQITTIQASHLSAIILVNL
jgi:hypothetical protein